MNTTSLGGAIAIDVSGAPSAFAVAFMQLSDVMKAPNRAVAMKRVREDMEMGTGCGAVGRQ